MKIDGRVIVITGAAGGVGTAAAKRFAAEGARVVLTDIDEAPLPMGQPLRQENLP